MVHHEPRRDGQAAGAADHRLRVEKNSTPSLGKQTGGPWLQQMVTYLD